jgi:integrase
VAIGPYAKGGVVDTGNYRGRRVLRKLAEDLELPKLAFQVIQRTIATLAQEKGTVKDVQGLLRHSRAATTTDVYEQGDHGERASDRQRDSCSTQSEAGRNSP